MTFRNAFCGCLASTLPWEAHGWVVPQRRAFGGEKCGDQKAAGRNLPRLRLCHLRREGGRVEDVGGAIYRHGPQVGRD